MSTSPQIPQPIRDVVESARKVVKTHVELRQAIVDEASPRVLKTKGEARNRALDDLATKVKAFETALAAAREKYAVAKAEAKAKKPPFDWAGLFRTAGAFAGVVHSAMNGDPETAKKATEFIDVEFSEVKDSKRR